MNRCQLASMVSMNVNCNKAKNKNLVSETLPFNIQFNPIALVDFIENEKIKKLFDRKSYILKKIFRMV